MSIRLSEKHGVNPAIPRCYLCGEYKNEVVLFGALPKDAEAPRDAVIDTEPCAKCQEYMSQGIIIISVYDGESDRMAAEQETHKLKQDYTDIRDRNKRLEYIPNPRRSGGWWVIKEEGFRGALIDGLGAPEVIVERMCKLRWAFLDDKICEAMGLEPAGEEDGEQAGVDVPGRGEDGP